MSIPDTNSPHRAVQIVHRYWEALRHGRQMPLRSEIDPRGLEGALEYAFILERVAPQVARFRLAGQHISALAGAEVRGMPVTTLFTAAARDEAARAIEAVFKGPEMIEIALAADRPGGMPAPLAQLLLLPMQSDLGDVSRALGCLVGGPDPMRAPHRFNISGIVAAPILAGRPVAGGADGWARPAARLRLVAGGAAPLDSPRTEDRAPASRARLHLVKSD